MGFRGRGVPITGSTRGIGLATVEEVAAAILFLASDAASFITGAALPADGARTAGG